MKFSVSAEAVQHKMTAKTIEDKNNKYNLYILGVCPVTQQILFNTIKKLILRCSQHSFARQNPSAQRIAYEIGFKVVFNNFSVI